MQRTRVRSSNLYSVGHDETGLEIQFHSPKCPGSVALGTCVCQGGTTYFYPGVPAHLHEHMMESNSIGKYFTYNVRNAENADGSKRYPAVKVTA